MYGTKTRPRKPEKASKINDSRRCSDRQGAAELDSAVLASTPEHLSYHCAGSSKGRSLVDARGDSVEPHGSGFGLKNKGAPPATGGRQGRKEMTAEVFRTVSTCIAAIFVSTMLVTAATSMPALI